MNEDGILKICEAFGLKASGTHGGSRGINISISCPLSVSRHGDPNDTNLSCSVSVSDDSPSLAKCFSSNCNFKGSFYRMLEEAVETRGRPAELLLLLQKIEPTERFTLFSALTRSKSRFELSVEASKTPRIQTVDHDVLDESRLTPFRFGVPRYALDRGLTIETCKEWELGYDKIGMRLVFPFRRYDGKLIGLTGRTLPSEIKRAKKEGREVSKYHNYAGLDKERYLFGEHRFKVGEPIVIVEGQIDAILTRQHIQLNAGAPLGEGFSGYHVKTICAFTPPVVYLFPDNDSAGWMMAEKVSYALRGRVGMRIMIPPPGKDPGDLTKEEAQEALKNSKPVLGKINWGELGVLIEADE